ncbi:MAG: cytochrome c553 [Pseudoalteromonas tetraodonis]
MIFEEQCMECHRYNGSGEKVFGSSPLTAFQDWYLAAQLEKFRLGVRGYHGEDEKGQQMRHLASYLSEGEVRDVSAYIATLAKRYPPKRR